jgi:hypothetical protein
MKNKIIAYAFIPAVFSFGLLGTTIASAHGLFGGNPMLTPEQLSQRQQTMFENEAKILGISVADLKEAWADGKTFKQIISEKGLNEADIKARMQAERDTQMKAQLDQLVAKGTITQAQADRRLKAMQAKMAAGKGSMGMKMHRGGGMGMGF